MKLDLQAGDFMPVQGHAAEIQREHRGDAGIGRGRKKKIYERSVFTAGHVRDSPMYYRCGHNKQPGAVHKHGRVSGAVVADV
jgi:hypothetical protein